MELRLELRPVKEKTLCYIISTHTGDSQFQMFSFEMSKDKAIEWMKEEIHNVKQQYTYEYMEINIANILGHFFFITYIS